MGAKGVPRASLGGSRGLSATTQVLPAPGLPSLVGLDDLCRNEV